MRHVLAGALVAFLALTRCLAAPPEILGGPFLSDSPGDNLQPILTYETSVPFDVTIHDPDPSGVVTVDITVGGDLGGLMGGVLDVIIASGQPHLFSPRFIAGVTQGTSWLQITASDDTATTKKFINFRIEPHPDPPPGELFEVGARDGGSPQQHERFLVLVTDPVQIGLARDILAGVEQQRIVIGRVVKGSGGFNRNTILAQEPEWSWHLDPASVAFVDFTIELCDAAPCYIEEQRDAWIANVGDYCPWSTYLRGYRPEPPPEPVLKLAGGPTMLISWDPVPEAAHYDLVRGRLSQLTARGCLSVDLGEVACLLNDSTATAAPLDPEPPPEEDGFFYLLRYQSGFGNSMYGCSSRSETRKIFTTECPP